MTMAQRVDDNSIWYQLDDARIAFNHPGGFIVVKPTNDVGSVPIFCDVCGFPNLTTDDVVSHRENFCCSRCALRWVDAKREEWKLGWRPSHDEVAAEVKMRTARGYRMF
jgi:hypothetical protein